MPADLLLLTGDTAITTSPADSANWLETSNRLTSMDVQYRLLGGTATWTLQQSLDGGGSFDPVGSGVSASDIVSIPRPIGLYKVTTSACAGCGLLVHVRCGAAEGGRP